MRARCEANLAKSPWIGYHWFWRRTHTPAGSPARARREPHEVGGGQVRGVRLRLSTWLREPSASLDVGSQMEDAPNAAT